MPTWILNALGNIIRTDYLVLYKNRNDISEYREFAPLNGLERRVLESVILTPESGFSYEPRAPTLSINPTDRPYEWRTTNDNNQADASGNVRERGTLGLSDFVHS